MNLKIGIKFYKKFMKIIVYPHLYSMYKKNVTTFYLTITLHDNFILLFFLNFFYFKFFKTIQTFLRTCH